MRSAYDPTDWQHVEELGYAGGEEGDRDDREEDYISPSSWEGVGKE